MLCSDGEPPHPGWETRDRLGAQTADGRRSRPIASPAQDARVSDYTGSIAASRDCCDASQSRNRHWRNAEIGRAIAKVAAPANYRTRRGQSTVTRDGRYRDVRCRRCPKKSDGPSENRAVQTTPRNNADHRSKKKQATRAAEIAIHRFNSMPDTRLRRTSRPRVERGVMFYRRGELSLLNLLRP